MMSDVPYGAFLSGGVDSAGVVAAMKLRSGTPPTTFTIGFPGHGDVLDERALAAESARIIGTDHHDTVMHETDFLSELARCIPRLEEPCGIPSAPALLQLSRFAAEDVKVVLAGQGADEPHGGYGRHQAAALLAPLKLVPSAAATPAAALARALPRAAAARRVAHLLGGQGDTERLLRLVEITDATSAPGCSAARRPTDAEGERLARARDDPRRRRGPRPARAGAPPGHPHVPARRHPALQRQDVDGRRPRAARAVPRPRADAVGGAHPGPRRVRPRRRKRLHKRAMERLLPPEVVNRRKHGFATPYDDWLRASLGEEVERRYAPGSALAELIDPAAAARLVDEHRRGRADHKAILYCLLELSEWHRAFVEAREPVAA